MQPLEFPQNDNNFLQKLEIFNTHKPTTALRNNKLTSLELGDWVHCNFFSPLFAIVIKFSSEMKAEVFILKLDSTINNYNNIVSSIGK